MFKRILVPLDGSALAEKALAPAYALAKKAAGKVILLRVPTPEIIVPHPVTGGYGVWLPEQSEKKAFAEAEDYLTNKASRYDLPNVTTLKITVGGDPASIIVDTATDADVDLIVMSTHGRSGMNRWIMGSVTEKVMQDAPCPVLALRSDEPIENVLITVDGSTLTETALIPGLELARGLNANSTILRVDPKKEFLDKRDLDELDNLEPGLGDMARLDFYERIPRYVATVAEKYGEEGEIETAVAEGNPAERILEVAKELGTDVIVMATHGNTGMRRWLYGSTTYKVLRATDRSMLIIRPPVEAYEE